MQKLLKLVRKLEPRSNYLSPNKTIRSTWRDNAFHQYQNPIMDLIFKIELKMRGTTVSLLPMMHTSEMPTQASKETSKVVSTVIDGNRM